MTDQTHTTIYTIIGGKVIRTRQALRQRPAPATTTVDRLLDRATQPRRRHVDSTGIALKVFGAVLVFAVLCVFGWPGLLVLLLLPMFL
jgi:hypothetical protein